VNGEQMSDAAHSKLDERLAVPKSVAEDTNILGTCSPAECSTYTCMPRAGR
jgi:hypothetical protein